MGASTVPSSPVPSSHLLLEPQRYAHNAPLSHIFRHGDRGCMLCALLGTGGALATAASQPTGRPVQPGPPFVLVGYGYTCQSTVRTPAFSCSYNEPYRPTGTPIMTISKGSRTMYIQSFQRPTVSKVGDEDRLVSAFRDYPPPGTSSRMARRPLPGRVTCAISRAVRAECSGSCQVVVRSRCHVAHL